MIVIPYWTNAPIYYYPIMTALLIVINCIVSIFALLNHEYLEMMILRADGAVEPMTWITSFFIHADFMHLFGNMMFLWCFGVIVEGRLGHFWMTLCYLTVGIVQAAGLQMIMYIFSQIEPLEIHGALGASAAIYGLMVMAFLWSFDDDLISFVVLYPFYINYSLAVPLGFYCFIYLSFDILEALLQGWSSGLLHVLGAIVGLIVGLIVTPTGLVKGSKQNFLQWVTSLPEKVASSSIVNSNRDTTVSGSAAGQSHDQEQLELSRQEMLKQDALSVHQKVRTLVSTGQFALAEERMNHLVATNPYAHWDSNLMLAIIQGYTKSQKWPEADHLIDNYTKLFPNQDFIPVRLRWIQVKLQREMPRKALQLMRSLQGFPVTASQKQAISDLANHARQMIADGVIELE